MFSRKEAREWNKRFYTAFGVFMRKHTPQSDFYKKLKWLNYKTGVKNILFRIEATKKYGQVSIDMTHPDQGVREIFFEQFMEFRNALESYLSGEWIWEPEFELENGQQISRIYIRKEGLNLYREDDWGDFFRFFEQHFLELDAFWTDFKEGFVELAE